MHVNESSVCTPYLSTLAEGYPFTMSFMSSHYIAQVALPQEVIYCLLIVLMIIAVDCYGVVSCDNG
jgi:hypothetical protein